MTKIKADTISSFAKIPIFNKSAAIHIFHWHQLKDKVYINYHILTHLLDESELLPKRVVPYSTDIVGHCTCDLQTWLEELYITRNYL